MVSTPILTVYDTDGNPIKIPAIMGKSAYKYAVSAGYTGTEEEFAKLLANLPEVVQETGGSETEVMSQAATTREINSLSEAIADLPNNETLIDNVAEVVKTEVPLVKTAEQPIFVESIEECTDTTKMYVLPDGYIYAYMNKSGYGDANIMPVGTAQTKNGLTTTLDGSGGYILNGTATAAAVHKIYESTSALPDGFVAGGKYKIVLVSGYIGSTSIMYYDGANWISASEIIADATLEVGEEREFTIPETAIGMTFKYYPAVNYEYVNESVVYACYAYTEGMGFASTGILFVTTDYENRIVALEDAVKNLGGAIGDLPKPMLTIIDDDGYKKFTTLLLPIVQEKGVPISSAVVVGRANGEDEDNVTAAVMDWTEIETAYLYGAEILSHTYWHLSQAKAETMTKTEIQYDYQRAQYALRKHGIKSDGLVFAGASCDMEVCKNACANVYQYAFKSYGNLINFKGETDPYQIERYKIEPDGLLTETDLTGLIDALVDEGTGWMVWMIHTSDSAFQQDQADIIGAVIDYAIKQGVEIVTAECGARHYL